MTTAPVEAAQAAPRVKFAIVREDPLTELALVDRYGARRVLCVASGGCTALEIASQRPGVEVVAYDFNPAQLAHIEQKAEAIARGDRAALNVGAPGAEGINDRGDFERLFRIWREAFHQLVAPPSDVARFFDVATSAPEREALRRAWVSSPYWPTLFGMAFHHPLLDVMFGPAATQHAEPGSYPRYFRAVFERGLARLDAPRNPFMQHIFLGFFAEGDAHAHLRAAEAPKLVLVRGGIPEIEDLGSYDLIHLSNIFDWSDDALVEQWSAAIVAQAKPGCVVTWRQLNNGRNLRAFFEPTFAFDAALGQALWEADRSLFYNRIDVGVRRAEG